MKLIKLNLLLVLVLGYFHFTCAQNVQDFKIKLLGAANLNYRKSPKKVVISDFQLNFQTALEMQDKKAGGKMWRGGLKGDATASLALALEGLNEASLQEITNQLFEQYKAELNANGFEVVPIEGLWANNAYDKSRDKRWELKAGKGAEKGNVFGDIVMRPSSQQFIVAKKSFNGKQKNNFTVLSDFETQVESKIASQKNDFIFNKVVIYIQAFANSMSEAERSLNRMAGYAQVKAETDFRLSDMSFNKFGSGQMIAKDGVEVTNVLEKQNFDASQAADVDKLGTDVGVLRIWDVDDREEMTLGVVKCDPDKYGKGTQLGVEAFLKATVQKLREKS